MPKLLLDGGEGEKGMGRQVGVGAGGGVRGVGSVMRADAIPARGRFWARLHLRAGMGSGVMPCVA